MTRGKSTTRKSTTRKAAPTRAQPARPSAPEPPTGVPELEALSPEDRTFVLAYLANGGNGTRAYLAAHPEAKVTTAATEAWKRLRNPEIRRALEAQRAELWRRLEMSAEEALALVALSARADIADIYGPDGRMLPVHEWPDSFRLAVRGIEFKKSGPKITLHDGLRAREIVLTAAGRLRQQHDHTHTVTLEDLVAGAAESE